MRFIPLVLALALSGCVTVTAAPPRPAPQPIPVPAPRAAPAPTRAPQVSPRAFAGVVNRMLPVAVQECRARTRNVRCDYAIVVDDRPGVPANAFQTLSPDGQPVVGFTLPLILEARNVDELAFVLGHEAAHHIEGHIGRGQASATTGAAIAGLAVALGGGDQVAIQRAQNVGAFYGSRRFSKDYELEADALGTVLTLRAGYDPVRGVAFFDNAPDPGNQFLGSHPPNADRIRLVRRIAAGG